MKKIVLIVALLSFLNSCSKEQETKTESPAESTAKIIRHSIDPEEEGYDIEQVLKIDQELPVVHLIVPASWDQAALDKIAQLELLEEITFNKIDLSAKNINFIAKRRTLKTLKFQQCTLNDDIFELIKKTIVEKITFSKTPLTKTIIQSLLKAPRLKEVSTDQETDTLQSSLADIKISKI
jgi:hypothetical protein